MMRVILLRSDSGIHNLRLRTEAALLVASGFDVTVLLWDRADEHPEITQFEGARVIRYAARAPFASLGLARAIPGWWRFIFSTLRAEKPDVIHACDFDTLPPAWAASRFVPRSRLVYDAYDFYWQKSATIPAFLKPLVRHSEQSFMRGADSVVIPDHSRLPAVPRGTRSRALVFPNVPIDTIGAFSPVRELPLKIFYGGLIDGNRGISELLSLVEAIPGCTLRIAGWIRDPGIGAQIERCGRATYLGLIPADRVVEEVLQAHLVYSCYNPALEINRVANPSKVFEALMCSRPVITNLEYPMGRVVDEERIGIAAPFGAVGALTAGVRMLMADPARLLEMSKRCRSVFEDRYSAATQGRQLLSLYRSFETAYQN